jgi:hypothetical protein
MFSLDPATIRHARSLWRRAIPATGKFADPQARDLAPISKPLSCQLCVVPAMLLSNRVAVPGPRQKRANGIAIPTPHLVFRLLPAR